MTSQFSNKTSTTFFFKIILFLLSSLVTGPSFMSIWSLVMELLQFRFIRDWAKIRKSLIPPPELCSISGDWSELGISDLAQKFLIKRYWMLQNVKVVAFTVSELLKENQQERERGGGGGGGGGGEGGGRLGKIIPHPD